MIRVDKAVFPSNDQWEIVIQGMRNPFMSWYRNDSTVCNTSVPKDTEFKKRYCSICPYCKLQVIDGELDYYCSNSSEEEFFVLGQNDRNLLLNLSKLGSSDRKVLRQLPVILTITAPEYMFKQLDTYKVGTTTSSSSLMHTMLSKPFEVSDFSFESLSGYRNVVRQEEPEFTEEELANEEWADLGNGYQVSNLGRVKGILKDFLKPYIDPNSGYCRINIHSKHYQLHRIVAECFCPRCFGANEVNHINGNKQDNRAVNLEWVTHKRNVDHSIKTELRIPGRKTKFTEEQIHDIKEKYKTGTYSQKQIAKEYGVHQATIYRIVNNLYKYVYDNDFEDYALPLVDSLNELRDKYIIETDEVKKQELWKSILELMPQSYNYIRTLSLNYEVLVNYYFQRHKHKLSEHVALSQWLLTHVPYFQEIIQAIESEEVK